MKNYTLTTRPFLGSWRIQAGVVFLGWAVLGKCSGFGLHRQPSFTEEAGLRQTRVPRSHRVSAPEVQFWEDDVKDPPIDGLWRLFSEPTQKNPFVEVPELATFMKRFDIPTVHGSGIYVDLGGRTEGYREVSGKCPVFGKVIHLHQPVAYKNTFLDDVASPSQAYRKPLPGGFNSPHITGSGRKFSPISDAEIRSRLGDTSPKTEIGRCASYALATTPQNPKSGAPSMYKNPFVYDRVNKQCYVLAISAQLLKGQKYCSVNGSPSGLTWSCFEPARDLATAEQFVYGSAHVGESYPDSWEERCPHYSVSNAVFGKWSEGECVPFNADNSLHTIEVTTKEKCWAYVFENPDVASDAPTTYPDTPQNSWRDFWPVHESSSPASGGVGANWANFYRDPSTGKGLCAVFNTVPDCFVPLEDTVAYTALGSLAEQPLPTCDPGNFSYAQGECRDCKRTILRCEDNRLVQEQESCCSSPPPVTPVPPAPGPTPPAPIPQPAPTPPAPTQPTPDPVTPVVPDNPGTDGGGSPDTQQPNPGGSGPAESEEEGPNVVAIAGGVIGGLLLLILVGAGAGYYFQHKGPEASEAVANEVQGGRPVHSPSDVAANTSQSYWGEELLTDAKP